MNNLVRKQITLRKARAMCLVICQSETINLIKQNLLPKGNVFEFARAAGFLGAKNTQHLLPHCHPVSIDAMDISFEFIDAGKHADLIPPAYLETSGILIQAEAQSIGRTGIEMEVLTGVSIAALEIYDFLKPHDKHLEISSLKLLEKTGGKNDKRTVFSNQPQCAVLVCSDSIASDIRTGKGMNADRSGKVLKEILEEKGARVDYFEIVSDDEQQIKNQIQAWIEQDIPYIFSTGGTGLGPRDLTVEAVKGLIEREVAGITEAMRNYGKAMAPTAILSRAVAGTAGKSLIITLPGSPAGVRESLDAILPAIFHSQSMMEGGKH